MYFFERSEKDKRYNTLSSIERRLLEIEEEKPRRIHNLSENYSSSFEDELEAMEIGYLDIEKIQLQTKRQFMLDERNDWKSRMIWNMLIPVLVALTTSVVTKYYLSQ